MKNIDKVKHLDWIFTCSMKPQQFDTFLPRNPKVYSRKYLKTLNEEEYSNFIYDDFQTINGSNHSVEHCKCEVISETYAKWFLDNNIDSLYEKHEQADAATAWENYRAEVKLLAEEAGLIYEGV